MTMLMKCAALLVLFGFAGAMQAAEFYVAPDGKADNPGTRAAPWDIASALAGKQKVAPGDTIWITGGAYKTPERGQGGKPFSVRLAGSEEKHILVRAALGERAVIDGGLEVQAPSQYLWLQDLEIIVSENFTMPRKLTEGGSHPKSYARPWGSVNILAGKGCKYINLVVHDNAQGIGFWRGAIDSEVHGCVIYNNGWIGPDRCHGPGIYTQNQTGDKWITDNIICHNNSTTIQAYGSKNAYVDHFRVVGNIAFAPVEKGGRARILIGGGRPSQDIVAKDNILYDVPLQLGYGAKDNKSAVVEGNTIIRAGLSISNYTEVQQKDNFVWTPKDPRPEKPAVFLRPNKYDEDRANLAIVNWPKGKNVDVDLGAFLKKGDAFYIRNVLDYFGTPVVTGTYAGEPVAVPVPVNAETGQGEFCAYVVCRGTPPDWLGKE